MSVSTSPCLLWVVINGSSAGNVLRTGVLARLLDLVPDARVVLMSPLVADAAFTAEFAHPRVAFEPLPAHMPGRLERRLINLLQAHYFERCTTETIRIKVAAGHVGTAMRFRAVRARVGRALAPRAAEGRWYDVVDRVVTNASTDAVIARWRPTLVAASTPGLSFAEMPVLRSAARQGIPTMAVDLSWDNLTNKLLPIRRLNRLVVWNDTMKAEAHDLHGYDRADVDVCGPPQFDAYFASDARSSRADFCRRVGVDPASHLLTLTTVPAESYPRHDIVIDHLLKAIHNNAFAQPCDLLVRVHPRDDLRKYERYRGIPHVSIEKPFRDGARSGDGHSVDVTVENTRHLADTMRYSDVVLNVASTITIEAAIFDTPVVNIAFDERDAEAQPFLESPLRYYSYTHYQQIVGAGAVRIAKTPSQMIELVNAYLRDPSLDAAGRRRVVLEQCQFTDGRSAERVAHAMARQLAANAVDAAAAPMRAAALR